jgi:beta-lactamase superfamily II metal-dependent hydrolase
MNALRLLALTFGQWLLTTSLGLGFQLEPVGEEDWQLKIVFPNVGRADACVVIARNGDAAIIDAGSGPQHGEMIADFLLNPQANGADRIDTLRFLFASHYHGDHIGGVAGLSGRIRALVAYDQGPSQLRDPTNLESSYASYLHFVGDPDGDGFQGENEKHFIRHKAYPGLSVSMGRYHQIRILVMSVNGNTLGCDHDLPLDPSTRGEDENPGSLSLIIRLGHFEFVTSGDATGDEWQDKADTEQQLLDANAIPGGDDVDVIKVSHHGSDWSTGKHFIGRIRPELAVICSDAVHSSLPKLTALKVLEMYGCQVLVTGSATDESGHYHESEHPFDDGYSPSAVLGKQGWITILVPPGGRKYTVYTEVGFEKTFSAVDAENVPGF